MMSKHDNSGRRTQSAVAVERAPPFLRALRIAPPRVVVASKTLGHGNEITIFDST